MTKLVKLVSVSVRSEFLVHLVFSDGSSGTIDFAPILAQDSALTIPLRDAARFGELFIDMGALCWPIGLEFSAAGLQARLRDAGTLERDYSTAL